MLRNSKIFGKVPSKKRGTLMTTMVTMTQKIANGDIPVVQYLENLIDTDTFRCVNTVLSYGCISNIPT